MLFLCLAKATNGAIYLSRCHCPYFCVSPGWERFFSTYSISTSVSAYVPNGYYFSESNSYDYHRYNHPSQTSRPHPPTPAAIPKHHGSKRGHYDHSHSTSTIGNSFPDAQQPKCLPNRLQASRPFVQRHQTHRQLQRSRVHPSRSVPDVDEIQGPAGQETAVGGQRCMPPLPFYHSSSMLFGWIGANY